MKIIKWLDDHFEETLLCILLILISAVELVQVIIRNIPAVPALQWAEEFCRFCWIWSVFLSLPYTIKMASMLRVSVLIDAFPRAVRNSLNIAVDVINTAVMAILLVYSVPVVSNIMNSGEVSSAMVWPMWIVYSVLIIGFFLGVLRGIQKTVEHIRSFGEKGLSTAEQTMADAAEEVEAGRRAEGGAE